MTQKDAPEGFRATIRGVLARFSEGFPPGHFYSPIPSLSSVFKREAKIFDMPPEIPGVDLNVDYQVEVLSALSDLCADQPFIAEGPSPTRFQSPNDNFSAGEACVYYGLLRYWRPRRVIEIGSGYSTLVLLDTLDRSDMHTTECLAIEPYPDLLRKLLRPDDVGRVQILEQELQDVPLDVFAKLEPNDVLFIDSTHVAKTGSDVNTIFFHVLPYLAVGVCVHIHDIYYPFEYPKEWVRQGRAWNEAYMLRAFLQYNPTFRICFFNSYMAAFHRHLLKQSMYAYALQPGSSLWLRKVS
ncbi:MAG TPA: class I SAM-dependent methyltransferase [Bryobacteraceae bacterium]|nr:class I SAM-dependent methyltransferase [Bryobacteraceae bacterium]